MGVAFVEEKTSNFLWEGGEEGVEEVEGGEVKGEGVQGE
jgi:hypothetical protein